MARTILVCGHGPGISDAVARRFGREGYSVALVARDAARLERAAAELGKAGVTAKAFPCNLGDPAAVRSLVRDVHGALGPVAIVHWNAYAALAGDLTTCSTDELRTVLDVGVHGLVAAVQEALPDLRAEKGAVLVTGGGFAFDDPQVNAMIVEWNTMGISISKAAQHKLVGVLNKKLAGDGVYVGEVMVLGVVKGTAFDAGGHGQLEAADIAEKFWDIFQRRTDVSVRFP